MAYKILIEYQTGDSFHNEDTEDYLDVTWSDVTIAAENLERIQKHYKLYQELHRNYHGSFKEMKKKYGHEDWFVDDDSATVEKTFLAAHSIHLYTDDGTRFRQNCFWCGYFEQLYGGSIKREDLPSFTV